MKKTVLSVLLVIGILTVGCNKTKTSSDSSVSDTLISGVESSIDPSFTETEKLPEEVTVKEYGEFTYTVTLTNVDGSINKYLGKTDAFSLMELFAEIKDLTDFDYNLAVSDTGLARFKDINGQSVDGGYFAVYVNGKLISDFAAVTKNTMITNDMEIVIRYGTTNVCYNSEYVIPSAEDIYTVSIIDMRDENKSITYSYYDNGTNVEFTYFEDVGESELTTQQTAVVTYDEFDQVKALVTSLNASEVVVLGNKMPTENDNKYIIMINDFIFLTSSQSITDYISSLND